MTFLFAPNKKETTKKYGVISPIMGHQLQKAALAFGIGSIGTTTVEPMTSAPRRWAISRMSWGCCPCCCRYLFAIFSNWENWSHWLIVYYDYYDILCFKWVQSTNQIFSDVSFVDLHWTRGEQDRPTLWRVHLWSRRFVLLLETRDAKVDMKMISYTWLTRGFESARIRRFGRQNSLSVQEMYWHVLLQCLEQT